MGAGGESRRTGRVASERNADLSPAPSSSPPVFVARDVPIGELREYERNARVHPPEQIQQIADSIKTFGFVWPILVDTNTHEIIAGHGRLMAAKVLGRETVPVAEISHLTAEQVKLFRIADNKLALNAAWNYQMLGEEIKGLLVTADELKLLGFPPEELAAMARGWDADLDRVQGVGENTDPMRKTVLVECEVKDYDDVREVIKQALEATAIEHVSIK